MPDGVYGVYGDCVCEQTAASGTGDSAVAWVCKGESTASLSRELGVAYDTVHHLRQDLQANAIRLQPDTPLPDEVTETDEMFQNAGEKRRKT